MEWSASAIKSWALEDRPREKLMLKGMNALSNAELLAILIGSGSRSESALSLAQKILTTYQNNLHEMGRLGLKDLQAFKGIGEAKAVSIMAALELGRRRQQADMIERAKISCSRDVYEYIGAYMLDLPHEEFWVMYLNRSNKVISCEQVSVGGVSGTVADAKLIFKKAITHLANSIILIHNHPSGNTQPSASDNLLTQKMSEVGKLMDIPVSDHLIIAAKAYYSYADDGEL